MADAILYGVVQKIIETLASSTLKEIGSIWGVKDELEKMNDTVLTIQAVLPDAEEQQVQNHQVKLWLNRLRDVVFDADDLLSEFDTHVFRRKVMGGDKMAKKVRIFFSRSNQLVFSFKMACEVKATREKLNNIATDWKNFHLKLVERPLKTQDVTRGRDQTHSYIGEEEVIGREEDKEAIIKLLLDFNEKDKHIKKKEKDNVSFISIVGIGGLGKTTLAQYVYNDKNVNDYFELKMWVCVSDDFDVKKIVGKIIESATKKKPEYLGMDLLQDDLRKELKEKKFLLVLDDIWNENKEKWCELKRLLMGGAQGSKVVITTRTKVVANIISTINLHVLSGLKEDKSWALLKQMAFEEGKKTIDPKFEEIGMKIVEKCQGVPLAIKTIGRVLYSKTIDEWFDIKNNELTNVTQLKDGFMPILKLSYDHLPLRLKCCFAYCSLFPKDYLIDKLTLIQLWIAQKFIQPEENRQLEDVANEYFIDLLWRSFFQESKEDGGMNRRFKMHDLIHDFAQSVSKSECILVNSKVNNVNEKVRHLSLSFDNVSFIRENLETLVKTNKIRTFILFGKTVEDSTLVPLISSFSYLRALDLHGLRMKTLPNTIGKLMHLKYLDLSSNEIEVLPSSFNRLVNLQTLKLSWCLKLKELPADFGKLVSLNHLDMDGSSWALTHIPCGLGKLTSLQTLSSFVVSKGPAGSSKHCGGLAELNKLNDLRGKLEIKNLAWVKDATSEFKAANLKEKQHLIELELRWNPEGDYSVDAGDNAVDTCDDENSMDGLQPHQSLKFLAVHGYMGVRFSSWLSLLTNLVVLRIQNCKKCQYLPPLYQLPSFRELYIWEMDGLEYMTEGDMNDEISASTFFPSLEELSLQNCRNLKGWWRRDKGNEATTTSTISSSSSTNHYHQHIPSFPRLSYLYLWECPMMTCMPLFPNLEKGLILSNSSLKPLEQTLEMKMMNTAGRASSFPSSSSSASSSFSPPLSKLKDLSLGKMELRSLPEEWFKNLTSLQRLNIRNCPNLTSLPEGMSHLASLHNLEIHNCPNLTSLPEGMSHLTSLQSLYIGGCLQLKQRCEKENGEDWNKISRIPNLDIR